MLSILEREILAKIWKEVKNIKIYFLTEMCRRNPSLSNTVDSISKCCIFIHCQQKICDGNCSREWIFQNFKFIFLKINFFNNTISNAHNSAKNRARDLLLVSFGREFYLVWRLTLTPNWQYGTSLYGRTHIIVGRHPRYSYKMNKNLFNLQVLTTYLGT